jgi:uncharacterized protein YecE (DUF72 family)
VCVDEPQGFPSSVPPIAIATTPQLAYVRFHGRNAETWEKRTETSAERFDHYYTAEELREWSPKVASLIDEAQEVHLILNTNNYDQGPANARLLEQCLREHGVEVVHSAPASDDPPAPRATPSEEQGQLL